MKYDYLIVGAGFSGLVMAERLANVLGKSVLVVEKRDHIGGNSADEYNECGVLVHKYGPHYFRTNSEKILDYLSMFTDWIDADYKILSYTHEQFYNFPINLNTFEQIIGKSATEEEMINTLDQWRVPIENPKNSEEVIISQVGKELYQKFFLGYTLKQWKKHPTELAASVCGRIPIRTNRDDRYLNEKYQVMPAKGYSALFRKLVQSDNIEIKLNTDYRVAMQDIDYSTMIYTGQVDTYYDYCFGRLPYRSLRFEHETFNASELVAKNIKNQVIKKGFYQPAVQINYPNDHEYTRTVEVKHITGQVSEYTTVVKEFPEDNGDPYYPVPTDENKELYKKYETLAKQEKNVLFTGRLAKYKYYNMDQVVGAALTLFDKIRQQEH